MNIGIFIDGENISSKEYKMILQDIRRHGTISISNIYVDWTENRSWMVVSKNYGITPIQCNKINKKKFFIYRQCIYINNQDYYTP